MEKLTGTQAMNPNAMIKAYHGIVVFATPARSLVQKRKKKLVYFIPQHLLQLERCQSSISKNKARCCCLGKFFAHGSHYGEWTEWVACSVILQVNTRAANSYASSNCCYTRFTKTMHCFIYPDKNRTIFLDQKKKSRLQLAWKWADVRSCHILRSTLTYPALMVEDTMESPALRSAVLITEFFFVGLQSICHAFHSTTRFMCSLIIVPFQDQILPSIGLR